MVQVRARKCVIAAGCVVAREVQCSHAMQKSNKKKLVLTPTVVRPLTDGELVRSGGGRTSTTVGTWVLCTMVPTIDC